MPGAQRADYGEIVLHDRLRSAFARLNPDVADDALVEKMTNVFDVAALRTLMDQSRSGEI